MKKHELRIKTNVNCNIYIDTEYACSAEANHFAKIELREEEYMVKVENAANPDVFFYTEVFLDKDMLIKDIDLENDTSGDVVISEDKTERDDSRCQKPSTASQISEIVESLANSKAEGKSQRSNTYNEDGQTNDKSSEKKENSSKGTINDDIKDDTIYKNDNTPSSVDWNKTGKYILIIILVIVIMIIASALGITLPSWFPMLFKYL